MGAAQFRKWQRSSALRRIHRPQLLRNVAVALGNAAASTSSPRSCSRSATPRRWSAPTSRGPSPQIAARTPLPPTSAAALTALLTAALAREPDAETRLELSAARDSIRTTTPRSL